MILKSFEELGVALPCPASPDASALVREADDLLEALGAMVHAARESRQRAAGQAETAATLADKAQAIEAQLAQAQGLTGFGVDGDVLETLEAQATAMRRLAQELQEDPAVQAYLAQQAAAAATQEQVTAATRRRLTQALGQARDWLRQGEHEKAAALIGEIRAAASKEDLAAEFEEATAELESIVAQAQETVKIRAAAAREREAAAQEREDRRAFARWLDRVREQADWSRGDVVVTLGLGQGLHLRPQPARRGHTVWHPLSHVGVEEPKGSISSLPRRAKVWDWRGQVPGAARTLAEAAQRAGPVSRPTTRRPRLLAVAEEPAPYAVPAPTAAPASSNEVAPDEASLSEVAPAGTMSPAPVSDQEHETPAGTPAPAPAGDQGHETPTGAPTATAGEAAPAGTGPAPAVPIAEDAVDALVQALVDELGVAAVDDQPVAEPPIDSDDGPALVVFEAENPSLARQWAETVAGLLQELGCDVLAATVEPGTPHIGVWGLVIADDEALVVDITVGERIWSAPVSLSATSRVPTPARRRANVTASLARQLARRQPAPTATP